MPIILDMSTVQKEEWKTGTKISLVFLWQCGRNSTRPLFKNTGPREGVVRAIEELNREEELYVLTSRPSQIEDITREQINTHFGGCFEEILFGNGSISGEEGTKLEVCKDRNLRMLVEDDPPH